MILFNISRLHVWTIYLCKYTYFFYPEKVGGSFNQSKPHFFSRYAAKKKHAIFSIFFWFFCVFFAYVKVHMLFIQSIWDLCFFFRSPEKKHSILIHSIDFVPNCVKFHILHNFGQNRLNEWKRCLGLRSNEWMTCELFKEKKKTEKTPKTLKEKKHNVLFKKIIETPPDFEWMAYELFLRKEKKKLYFFLREKNFGVLNE